MPTEKSLLFIKTSTNNLTLMEVLNKIFFDDIHGHSQTLSVIKQMANDSDCNLVSSFYDDTDDTFVFVFESSNLESFESYQPFII